MNSFLPANPNIAKGQVSYVLGVSEGGNLLTFAQEEKILWKYDAHWEPLLHTVYWLNNIFAFGKSKGKGVFIASEEGIFNLQDEQLVQYDLPGELPAITFEGGSFFETSNDEFWMNISSRNWVMRADISNKKQPFRTNPL
ncbi:MAG: hypothetical protein HC896_07355 [Bacteroidales bacterium]|nr:hypothetical protein [Bacteroidales bacterium]